MKGYRSIWMDNNTESTVYGVGLFFFVFLIEDVEDNYIEYKNKLITSKKNRVYWLPQLIIGT